MHGVSSAGGRRVIVYRKILLAFDGSPEGREALNQVADLVPRLGASVRLLAVIDPSENAMPVDGMSFVMDDEHLDTRAVLEDGLSRFHEKGFGGTVDIRYGDPAEQIILAAREDDVDLIVLGHRNQGALARWLNGSVGASVLRRAPCSVLIAVKPEPDLTRSAEIHDIGVLRQSRSVIPVRSREDAC
jgi:nucleotide-binding universal stress UspA family protein